MVGPMGYFQPFRDAVKLFVKRNLRLRFNLNFIWAFSPCFSLALYIILLIVFPIGGGYFFLNSIFLVFICIIRTRIYFLMFGGYFSGRAYCLLGRYRSVIQIISYEIVLIFLFVILFYFYSS
jgi:NADH:ubiquinone oxidoreductase subunit H